MADEAKSSSEALIDTLAFLEELLYEPFVADDGEEWNAAESKEAVAFRTELAALDSRAFPDFAEGSDEFALECTAHHAEFKSLVERHMDTFLKAKGLTTKDLVAQLGAAIGGVVTTTAAATTH